MVALRVALLAEGVDRNWSRPGSLPEVALVALLAEGVDRNKGRQQLAENKEVALLAEGVDRNNTMLQRAVSDDRRPPRGGRG